MALKDSATGIAFPAALTPPGVSAELVGLGAGVREKKVVLVNVRAYAIAAYVEKSAADALASFKGTAGSKLVSDTAFFSAIIDGNFAVAFTLAFARDVSPDMFSNNIKEALEPRLKANGAPPETLKSFVDTLSRAACTISSRIFFTLSGDKLIVSYLKAADVPSDLTPPASLSSTTIESAALVSAIKDLYLGKDAVTPTLKAAVAEGFAGGKL